jgi:hypothetical protein
MKTSNHMNVWQLSVGELKLKIQKFLLMSLTICSSCDVHELSAHGAVHICLSTSAIQLDKRWTDFDDI